MSTSCIVIREQPPKNLVKGKLSSCASSTHTASLTPVEWEGQEFPGLAPFVAPNSGVDLWVLGAEESAISAGILTTGINWSCCFLTWPLFCWPSLEEGIFYLLSAPQSWFIYVFDKLSDVELWAKQGCKPVVFFPFRRAYSENFNYTCKMLIHRWLIYRKKGTSLFNHTDGPFNNVLFPLLN